MKNNRFIENLDIKVEDLKGEFITKGQEIFGNILRGVIIKMVYKIAVKATTRYCRAKFIFINTAK